MMSWCAALFAAAVLVVATAQEVTQMQSACGTATALIRSQLGYKSITQNYQQDGTEPVDSKVSSIIAPRIMLQVNGGGFPDIQLSSSSANVCPAQYFSRNRALVSTTPFGATSGLVADDCAVECTARGDAGCHAFAFNSIAGTCELATVATLTGAAPAAGVVACIKGSAYVQFSFHKPATDGINLLVSDTPSHPLWRKQYCDGSDARFSGSNFYYTNEEVGDGTVHEVVNFNGTCAFWYHYGSNISPALAEGDVLQVSVWAKVFANAAHPISSPWQVQAYTGENSGTVNTGRMHGEVASLWPEDGWRLLKWVLPASNTGALVWDSLSFQMPSPGFRSSNADPHLHVAFAAPRVERMIAGPAVAIEVKPFWIRTDLVQATVDSIAEVLDGESLTVRLDFSEIGGPVVHSLDVMTMVDASGFTCQTGVSPQLLGRLTSGLWQKAFDVQGTKAPIQDQVCDQFNQTRFDEQVTGLQMSMDGITDQFNATFHCTQSSSPSNMLRWCRLRAKLP